MIVNETKKETQGNRRGGKAALLATRPKKAENTLAAIYGRQERRKSMQTSNTQPLPFSGQLLAS